MTFKTTSKDKILVRGDSLTLRYRVREKQQSPDDEIQYLDLTGNLATFTMKLIPVQGHDYRDVPPAVVKTSDDSLEIERSDQVDPETKGESRVFLRHEDTRFLPPGVYGYDIQEQTAQGSVYTVAEGRILLRSRPTEAEDQT